MGNSPSQRALKNATKKVILRDGTIQENLEDTEVTVAELMLEHPQQVVVELNSVLSAKRPIPLPADTKLDTKKIYLMLPMKRGKPAALSPEQARRIMLTYNSSRNYVPLFARICTVNLGHQMHEFSHVVQSDRVEEQGHRHRPLLLPETLPLERADILSRQISVKGNWKPCLDTIKEKKDDRKRLSPASLSSFKNLALSFSSFKQPRL